MNEVYEFANDQPTREQEQLFRMAGVDCRKVRRSDEFHSRHARCGVGACVHTSTYDLKWLAGLITRMVEEVDLLIVEIAMGFTRTNLAMVAGSPVIKLLMKK